MAKDRFTPSLTGRTLLVVGRLPGLTRRRLDGLVRAAGGRLAPRPGLRVDLVAVARSAAPRVLEDGRLPLQPGVPAGAALIGESALRRALGVLEPPPDVERRLRRGDVERLSGLSASRVTCLVLFGVLEPVDERFAWRDLVAARQAARLLGRGAALPDLLEAAQALHRRGSHLAEARLAAGPTGALLREIAGELAEVSGQLTLRLEPTVRSLDDLLDDAEQAEDRGDLATAESLYATALRAEPRDPVLPFNLGNVFRAQGRRTEAKVAWQIAVARDPTFAEAWYNLGLVAEDDGQVDLAVARYRRAVQAQPDFADAHFNLALLLTRRERYDQALPLWERFLELAPPPGQAATAHTAVALCHMHWRQDRSPGT